MASHVAGVVHGGRGGQSRAAEVIVHVQDVGEQRLGGRLLHVKLLHLVRHHDCLPCDFLSGPEINKEVNKSNAPERTLCLDSKDVGIWNFYWVKLLSWNVFIDWSIQSRP